MDHPQVYQQASAVPQQSTMMAKDSNTSSLYTRRAWDEAVGNFFDLRLQMPADACFPLFTKIKDTDEPTLLDHKHDGVARRYLGYLKSFKKRTGFGIVCSPSLPDTENEFKISRTLVLLHQKRWNLGQPLMFTLKSGQDKKGVEKPEVSHVFWLCEEEPANKSIDHLSSYPSEIIIGNDVAFMLDMSLQPEVKNTFVHYSDMREDAVHKRSKSEERRVC